MMMAGVRYRLANGVRSAARLWTGILIAYVASVGLHAEPPVFQWAAEWGSSRHPFLIALGVAGALAVAVHGLLRHALRFHGQEQFELLPLPARRRFLIDLLAVAYFMALPMVAFLAVASIAGVVAQAAAAMIVALPVQTLTLGRPKKREQRRSITRHRGPFSELRWLFRTGSLAGPEALAVACVIGASLAVRNNHVTSPWAIARIDSLFAALAAGALGSGVARARMLARPYRTLEATLPISSRGRMISLLLGIAPLAVPLLFAGYGLALGLVLFPAVVLLAESRSLRGRTPGAAVAFVSIAAALLAAVDARVALLAAIALLPAAWSSAVASDASCDLPVNPVMESPE
jgi:hypothetical protein